MNKMREDRSGRIKAIAEHKCRDCWVQLTAEHPFQRCAGCLAKNRANQRSCRERNKEKYKQKAKEYSRQARERDPERIRRWRKESNARKRAILYDLGPGVPQINQHRVYNMKSEYGLTVDQLRDILRRQVGCCGICGGVFQDTTDLHIDHNHVTGAVRGVLCNSCNTGIGLLNEDQERLLRAIDYLKKNNGPDANAGSV